MDALSKLEQRDDAPTEDHFVELHGVSWADYERLLAIRGEHSAPRMTYVEGTLEIMSPSRDHEGIKSFVGRLVEAYCLERNIVFTPYGSWTLKDRRKKRGVEPDECFILFGEKMDRPHLAIEVVWTSGGVEKLEAYRKLAVPEVWIWRKGHLRPFALRGEHYEELVRSELLPDLDIEMLVRFLDRPSAYHAIRDYRFALTRQLGSLAERTEFATRTPTASATKRRQKRTSRAARTSRPRSRGGSGKA
jgi:Uma2 family endonuclease